MPTCSITATFANTHGPGATVTSGSFGLQEAVNDLNKTTGGLVVIDASFGGTSATISSATTFSNAGILDLRSGVVNAGSQILQGACTGTATASTTARRWCRARRGSRACPTPASRTGHSPAATGPRGRARTPPARLRPRPRAKDASPMPSPDCAGAAKPIPERWRPAPGARAVVGSARSRREEGSNRRGAPITAQTPAGPPGR